MATPPPAATPLRPNPPRRPWGKTFEALESRRLLAVSFTDADIAGTYELAGEGGRGTIVADAAGNITGGDIGGLFDITGGEYQLRPRGDFDVTVLVEDFPSNYLGVLNSSKDVALLMDEPGDPGDSAIELALKHTGGAFAAADLAGVWNVAGAHVRGTITFAANGQITGGNLVDENGVAVAVTAGSATISAAGAVTADLTRAAASSIVPSSYSGAMNNAKNVLVLTRDEPDPDPDVDEDGALLVLTKQVAGFAAADLRGSFSMVMADVHAQVDFDGAGNIVGGIYLGEEGSGSVAGTYAVAGNGVASGTMVFTPAPDSPDAAPPAYNFVGQLSGTRNFLALNGATLPGAFESQARLGVLVKSDGPFATVEETGDLVVVGTVTADAVTIGADTGVISATLNGQTLTFAAADVTGDILVFLREGNDLLTLGRQVICYVDAGPGNDLLNGGDGPDTFTGGAGKDQLYGNGGADRLNGSGGHDILSGGLGTDRLYGGDGDDVLSGLSHVDRLFAGAGDDNLAGGNGNDKLYGNDGNDILAGNDGNDLLDGGADTDRLLGGAGDDVLVGGGGNDLLSGNAGLDAFFGGAGDDTIFAVDSVVELLDGGAGTDGGQGDPDDDWASIELEVPL
jgi:Ca2+-binding RTX toxin-like protein